MFSSDPFQRLTAGGTFNRTFRIFMQRYDLFLIIAGIIFVPLALISITIMRCFGTSMQTVLGAMEIQHSGDDAYASGGNYNNNSGDNAYPSDGVYNNNNGDPYVYSNYDGTDPMAAALLSNMRTFGCQFVLEYVALLILGIAGKAAIAYAVAELYAGRDPSWLDCLKKGFSRWCDVFGAAMLVGLGIALCNIFVEITIAVLAVIGGDNNGFMMFLILLVVIAWFVFIAYVMVSLMILAPVIMVEGSGPINSIKRSWELSWNNRCYIFCTIFCFCMIYYVVQIILSAIVMTAGGPGAVLSVWGAFVIILPAFLYLPLAVM